MLYMFQLLTFYCVAVLGPAQVRGQHTKTTGRAGKVAGAVRKK